MQRSQKNIRGMKGFLTRGFISVLTVLLVIACASSAWSVSGMTTSPFDVSYQKFLDRYVVRNKQVEGFTLNLVDYEKIVAEKDRADSLYREVLEELAGYDHASLETREAKVAFWVNVYNLGAIKMIVDHYPTDSIRSVKISLFRNPWGRDIITVGGEKLSLEQIEHDILLKELGEPMAHFGIVCASLSCPELAARAYRPETVMKQLREAAKKFVGDPTKGLRIDREKGEVWFSQIFKFDTNTFPNGARDAVPLISEFLDPESAHYLGAGEYKVVYLDYDWSLNAAQRAIPRN